MAKFEGTPNRVPFFMTKHEPFQQLARLCLHKGVENVIICPGSRNAALTIAFTSEKKLKCYSISDERSAAYIALGMALQTGKTSVIICTSGTAALNFAPAVAEAYFQEVPLLILTGDRPPEWVHQYDGQTIFQENLYGKHVKESFSWSADQDETNLDKAYRISNKALNTCQSQPQGPVHINIPIREPFYPEIINNLTIEWENETEEKYIENVDLKAFNQTLLKYPKRLLVIGQQYNISVKTQANIFAKRFDFVLVGDNISNIGGGIKNHDKFLKDLSDETKNALLPDLLISTDMSLISKPLKLMLRNAKIKEHWHVQNNPAFIDPFRSLTQKVEIEPNLFFQQTLSSEPYEINPAYRKDWEQLEKNADKFIRAYFSKPVFSEFHILKAIVEQIPADSIIHSGNSMSIRYLNALQSLLDPSVMFYSNRGTSGIDGSLSTAVGQALSTDKVVYCILGDLSFQYDKNALWNRYLPDNLRIIVLNNAGGIIFSMIDGPKKQEAFNDFFKTSQPNKADLIAEEYGLDYLSIRQSDEVEIGLDRFMRAKRRTILEIFTNYDDNVTAFKDFSM